MTLLYAALLLTCFYLLLSAEFFLPTSGFLGAIGVAALIAAVVIGFSHSRTAGLTVLAIALVTTPAIVFGLLKFWPHTPIGRRMLNRRPGQMAERAFARTTSRGTPLDDLVGQIAVAATNLLPSGRIVCDGAKVDAVSIGMPIDAGMKVMVTSVRAGKVQVRPATDQEIAAAEGEIKPQSPPSLERSLESFDVD